MPTPFRYTCGRGLLQKGNSKDCTVNAGLSARCARDTRLPDVVQDLREVHGSPEKGEIAFDCEEGAAAEPGAWCSCTSSGLTCLSAGWVRRTTTFRVGLEPVKRWREVIELTVTQPAPAESANKVHKPPICNTACCGIDQSNHVSGGPSFSGRCL